MTPVTSAKLKSLMRLALTRAHRLLKRRAERPLAHRTAKGFSVMTRRLTMLAVLFGTATAVASTQDSYRHGRILSAEPGVTLQRATEPGAEEASPNLPLLPGDRVWTDRAGRGEFQFADGTVLRLDSASKLDYVAHDDGAGDRVVLRLWSGGLYLHNRDGRGYPDFGIETPGGVVEARVRGVYRVDAVGGETRLSVYEGEAALQADREVLVQAGERAYARQGEPASDAQGFDRAALDDFDRWDADREDRQAYAASRRDYLPEVVAPYAGELDSYGAWYYQTEIGHVWRPYVAAAWRPYYDGRWAWTPYGWTWVAAEPWGWAPFHYGRWEYTPMLGWYWIPGNVWGPAWVSWAYGGDYIGWCPLGHDDRPALYGGRRTGRAVPHGTLSVGDQPWAYVRRADFAAADLPRRIQNTLAARQQVHPVEHAHARPDRDLHVTDGGTATRAVPRNVRTRPGPGDTTPELRTDPATTVPFPVARRRHRDPDEEAAPAGQSAPAATPRPGLVHPMRAVTPSEPAPEPPPSHPTDERQRAHPTDARSREARPADADHEVLRRVFGPLSQPRPAESGDRAEGRARPSAESPRPSPSRPAAAEPGRPGPSRAEPRATPGTPGEPQQRPSPAGSAHAAPRSQNEKDH